MAKLFATFGLVSLGCLRCRTAPFSSGKREVRWTAARRRVSQAKEEESSLAPGRRASGTVEPTGELCHLRSAEVDGKEVGIDFLPVDTQNNQTFPKTKK